MKNTTVKVSLRSVKDFFGLLKIAYMLESEDGAYKGSYPRINATVTHNDVVYNVVKDGAFDKAPNIINLNKILHAEKYKDICNCVLEFDFKEDWDFILPVMCSDIFFTDKNDRSHAIVTFAGMERRVSVEWRDNEIRRFDRPHFRDTELNRSPMLKEYNISYQLACNPQE